MNKFNESNDLEDFLLVMGEIGFDLIKYYADVYYRQETGLGSSDNIVNNKRASLIYSGCWYGGYFFEWLFPGLTVPLDNLGQNMFIHGEFDSNRESHYFFIITTDTDAIVLNTYGGITELVINTLPLNKANVLLERLRNNDTTTIEQLFGVQPIYNNMKLIQLSLEGLPYQNMSKEYLLAKIDELINKAHTIKDSDEITRLRLIVEEL